MFENRGFDEWLITATKVVKIILILHLLKFPVAIINYDYTKKFGIDIPSFGGLNSFHQERIKAVLGQQIMDHILQIAKEDVHVTELIGQIDGMPDISGEEIEKQIEDMHRMMKGNAEPMNGSEQPQL